MIFEGLSGADAGVAGQSCSAITHAAGGPAVPDPRLVHGLCLTAGFELSLACDLICRRRVARSSAWWRSWWALTPLMGGTQRVAERAGPARARELVMSGELYPAETLERWNVLNRVLPDDDLEEQTMAFAERLAAGPTLANAATKRIVRAQTDEGTRGADERHAGHRRARCSKPRTSRAAVQLVPREGPGKATFSGR